MIEENKIRRFCAENWTLKAKLLSKSSWSFVALAIILPVGVTSNQLKGVFKSAWINCLWMIREVATINCAKNLPLRYIRIPTMIDIPA